MNPSLSGSIVSATLPFLALLTSGCSMAVEEQPHPRVAFAAGSEAAPLCRVTAAPFVAARRQSKPYPPDGVIAFVDGERLSVAFNAVGPMERRCVAVDLATLGQTTARSSAELDACGRLGKTQPPVLVTSDAETMLAWDAVRGDQSELLVGVVVHDLAPGARPHAHVVAHVFPIPPNGFDGSTRAPSLADLGDGRFFLTWTQGNVEMTQLRAQPVAGWGDPIGPPIEVSAPDSSVVGGSSAAFTRDGSGAVAYFASAGDALELMVTPVNCSRSPAVPAEYR
jgi:hypothetical protein